MPVDVLLMVLGAALVHATWNALVKADGDKLSIIKLTFAGQIGVSLCLMMAEELKCGRQVPSGLVHADRDRG